MGARDAVFDTRAAAGASAALRGMRPLGAEDVGRWLDFWEKDGFLQV